MSESFDLQAYLSKGIESFEGDAAESAGERVHAALCRRHRRRVEKAQEG